MNRKKTTIKGQISHFKNFLIKYREGAPDAIKLETHLQKLKSAFEKFDNIQEEIEILDSETQNINRIIDRYSFQDDYLEAVAEAQNLLTSDQTVNSLDRASDISRSRAVDII